MTFRGFFSSRLGPAGPLGGTGSIAIRQGTGFNGQLVNQTPVASLTTATWTPVQATATVVSGQPYSFVVTMDNNLNFDEASVIYNADCVPPTPANPCCPPFSAQTLQDSFAYQGTGGISAPYTLKWAPPASLNAQMQAYINYIGLNPGITNINIAFTAWNAGTGNAPGTTGAQVGGPNQRTWTENAAPSGSTNFFNNGIMQVGTWYLIRSQIFLNDGQTFFPADCATRSFYVRVQVAPGAPAAPVAPGAQGASPRLEYRPAPNDAAPAMR